MTRFCFPCSEIKFSRTPFHGAKTAILPNAATQFAQRARTTKAEILVRAGRKAFPAEVDRYQDLDQSMCQVARYGRETGNKTYSIAERVRFKGNRTEKALRAISSLGLDPAPILRSRIENKLQAP